MLSKNKIKLFNALKKKKHRDDDQLFIVEGEKVVYEILKSDFEIELMVSTEQWLRKNQGLIYSRAEEVISIESTDIQKISSFKSPGEVLAIIKMPKQEYDKKEILDDISIVLDNVQDPGNLGTMIRTADWFGIKNIICSTDSVDVYNPKVIRATMGSICRVKIHYLDLEPFLHEYSSDGFPIYGTFITGINIYSHDLSKKGFIIMGNEATGISEKYYKFISDKIAIPCFPAGSKCTDSLNVATAAAIVCSEFRK